jgi:glycosyltransferase involved in cell wall biosynthesis
MGAASTGVRKVARIAVLNSHPIQYFAPLYAYLNALPDLDITALYLSDFSIRGAKDADFGREVKWDLDLLAGYRSMFLGNRAHGRVPDGFWSLIGPEVWSELRSRGYDVLWLHGHNYAANLIALLAAKTAGMHILMRGETHLALPRNSIKSMLRRPLMNQLYHLCDRVLAIGNANAAFYRAMGVCEQKIFLVPYSVDNDRFMKAAKMTSGERTEARARLGVQTNDPVILYAGKFTRRKRPLDLLRAVERLRKETTRSFAVVMAGSGELEHELRVFCAERSIDNVAFPGFVNQSDLPSLYGACDVFVLPSEHEPWGLAVNEAMCAGLPVVVSREVGCVPDLVVEGVNGFTPAAGDIDALAAALRTLIEDDATRRQQGRGSFDRITQWSYRECANGIRAALAGLDFQSSRTSSLSN